MKKYLAILLALMLIPASALAADVKISALPEATTMAASDLFVIVDVGTNTTKKITATNFFANIPAPFTFNTGGDSYIQFETNTTYDPSSGYHLYVEGGVFKLYAELQAALKDVDEKLKKYAPKKEEKKK